MSVIALVASGSANMQTIWHAVTQLRLASISSGEGAFFFATDMGAQEVDPGCQV